MTTILWGLLLLTRRDQTVACSLVINQEKKIPCPKFACGDCNLPGSFWFELRKFAHQQQKLFFATQKLQKNIGSSKSKNADTTSGSSSPTGKSIFLHLPILLPQTRTNCAAQSEKITHSSTKHSRWKGRKHSEFDPVCIASSCIRQPGWCFITWKRRKCRSSKKTVDYLWHTSIHSWYVSMFSATIMKRSHCETFYNI